MGSIVRAAAGIRLGRNVARIGRPRRWTPQRAWYVVPGGAGAGDGKSWARAFASIQDGIDAADAVADIKDVWVAAGTYSEALTIPGGVSVYGGFAGTELSLESRNWAANTVELTGDGNYQHVYGRLDGVVVRDIAVTGDALLRVRSPGSLRNAAVLGCTASEYIIAGGGYHQPCNGDLRNCLVADNILTDTPDAWGSVGVILIAEPATVASCTVAHNLATLASDPVSFEVHCLDELCFYNTSVWDVWGEGGWIKRTYGSGTIYAYHCNINFRSAGVAEVNCLDTDPLYVGGGNYRLSAASPNIDAGTSAEAPEYDLDGNPRPYPGTAVDIGAYEYGY